MRFSPHVLGAKGEARAARWYADRGYEIVARNWRCAEGEIDIVAARAGVIVFCEVKTRSSDRFGTPAEAVDARRRSRLRRAALAWLDGRRWYPQLRFDVAEVVGGDVRVIEGAF